MSAFITTDPGPLAPSIARATSRLEQLDFADALWRKRLDVWSADASTREKIGHRLGWLDVIAFITPQLPRLRALAASIRNEGLSDSVLLGMGGSSLAPEVLSEVLGVAPGYPRLRMLDSTDPDAVRTAMDRAATSLFIFASKSGSTIETGKIAGTDLRDGTPTLPLLLAAQQDDVVRHALAGGPMEGALVRVAATGALERSREVALDYASRARACLNGELHRDELEALTHAVVNRER